MDADEPHPPADRTIRMWGKVSSTGMWTTEGLPIWPEDLPISDALRARLDALARWYDRVDPPRGAFLWEGQPGTPTAEFSAETGALARALKAELPADWTVIARDVDSWRYPADDQAARRLDLPGTLPA